jgi:uncharacterized protein (DUF1800 family)
MKPVLSALFNSPHFWAQRNRGVLIKSPVELIVGTIRLFDLPVSEPRRLSRLGRQLEQDLFDPPNVKGWPGGTRWINTKSLLDRWQLLQRAVRGHEMGGHRHKMRNGRNMMNEHGPEWMEDATVEEIQSVLLPMAAVQPVPEDEARWQVVRHLVLDPTYQLK